MSGRSASIPAGLEGRFHWYLKDFCIKNEIDEQYIDPTLSYWENKENLETLFHVTLDSDEVVIQKQYQKYLAAEDQIAGEITPINKLIEIYKKWLYIEEDYAIVGPVCAATANFDVGDPDIWGLIGPSGSIKTEVLRSFGTTENKWVYPISSLTEHTFISGLDKSPDTDVIPALKGRLILIKDLTTILAKDEKIRSQIFADFRDIIDGYMDKKFGNRVHKTYNDIHSSILFASTNAIERYYSMYSCLGQRILFMRPRSNGDKSAEQAEKISDDVKLMRKEISDATALFMTETTWDTLPTITLEQRAEMRSYYKFLAIARTPINHDNQGNIDDIPEPELPTRIAKSINRMCRIHAMLYGREEVADDDLNFGLRIVYDNIPLKRLSVLKWLVDSKNPKLTITALADATKLGYATVRKILADLVALGVVERKSEGKEGTMKYNVCVEYEMNLIILMEKVSH